MGFRGTTLAVVAGLLAIGLYAASPFLCNRLVGTGEAFNYSLSTADAVVQMRAGILPPLAGQSLYAFNGRIHPLRDAPYLHYLAGAIDLATRHRLEFWELQNASLAFSLILAGLACYAGLRIGVGCPRLPAFAFSALYALSPALLCAAYTFDLFMTVHAAVFVPLAVGACLRGVLRPSFSSDAWLAAALAAAWLAHPPVAFWLTVCVAAVRLGFLVARPSARALARALCAAGIAAALSAFVFVSVHSLRSSTEVLAGEAAWRALADQILQGLKAAFPACLLPVTRDGAAVGNLQLGWIPWLLLAGSAAVLCRGRGPAEPAVRLRRASSAACVAAALALLALVVPLPFVTAWVWHHVPVTVLEITNLWPMQRLYLIALVFVLFGAALAQPWDLVRGKGRTLVWAAALLLFGCWTAYQAAPFIRRGYGDRRSLEETRASYRPSGLDLTVTSYAFIGTPDTFVNGVVDPLFEFRLLRGGETEVASPYSAAESTGTVVARGTLALGRPSQITLLPGRQYLLSFDFRTPPGTGLVLLRGELFHRVYSLPSAGRTRGFGMLAGQRRSFPLRTDSDHPEPVSVEVLIDGTAAPRGQSLPLADFTLREVRSDQLPVQVQGLVPLRFTVDAPELGLTVETPRRFIDGYEATVDGRGATPVASPGGNVMVAVPRGRSTVELTYRGSAATRGAFWLTAVSWGAFLLWLLAGSPSPARPLLGAARLFARTARVLARHAGYVVIAAGATAALVVSQRSQLRARSALDFIGPLQIHFTLPYGTVGQGQPLLATGHVGEGAIVFVTCLDASHVRVSADVWGQMFESRPVEVDYSRVHTLVVSDSALFPATHPRLLALPAAEQARLRGELSVELDGAVVIQKDTPAYEATPSEIYVGAAPFGSSNGRSFLGKVLDWERLPTPRRLRVPAGDAVDLRLRFPEGALGSSEPLAWAATGGRGRTVFATYLPGHAVRITSLGAAGEPASSAEAVLEGGPDHVLHLEFRESNDRALGFRIACSLDGRPLFGEGSGHFPYKGLEMVAGLNAGHVDKVDERFTGPLMDLTLDEAPAAGASLGDVLHLVVKLPAGRTGRQEPLLTTGHAGAGDVVFVVYEDAGHIRVGHDHWGVGNRLSEPIAVDYSLPHEFWIRSPALVGWSSPSGPVTVALDGAKVLTSELTPYASRANEISIGANRIGASSADAAFQGEIPFSETMKAPTR